MRLNDIVGLISIPELTWGYFLSPISVTCMIDSLCRPVTVSLIKRSCGQSKPVSSCKINNLIWLQSQVLREGMVFSQYNNNWARNDSKPCSLAISHTWNPQGVPSYNTSRLDGDEVIVQPISYSTWASGLFYMNAAANGEVKKVESEDQVKRWNHVWKRTAARSAVLNRSRCGLCIGLGKHIQNYNNLT